MYLKLVRANRAGCVLLALCFMNFGCSPNVNRATKYGVMANTMREQVGLPLLPTNWVLYGGFHRRVLTWFNPDGRALLAKGQPSHASKEVEVVGDKIVSETDTYWSGKMVTADEQKVEEAMVVTYSFDLAKQGKSPWSCFMPCGGGTFSKAQADEILKKWGISTDQRPK